MGETLSKIARQQAMKDMGGSQVRDADVIAFLYFTALTKVRRQLEEQERENKRLFTPGLPGQSKFKRHPGSQ